MLTAFFLGSLGTVLAVYLGQTQLGWQLSQVLWAVFFSNLIGFVALMSVLWLQRAERFRARLMPNVPASWVWLVTLYFGGMYLAVPNFYDPQTFGMLVLPFVLSTGFMIMVFGPLQDRLVAAMQRKERARKVAAAHESWNARAEIVGESHE